MGQLTGFICRTCGSRFSVREGGGFYFDLLHCDACGAARSVSHQELGDIHLAFVKGLPGPYAVTRTALDGTIKATFDGHPITRGEYRTAAEDTLDRCSCGGSFRYDAPPRCPDCRSTPDAWDVDRTAMHAFYD